MNRHAAISLFALLLAASATSKAQVPDLTNGGVPTNTRYTTLGPTGLQGWAYTAGNGYDGSDSRQILITHVDPGSPADGILQVGDVILGADGTGVVPVNFTYEARHALADAIDDAEALDPAILKLLVWRAGATSVHDLTLETLGAYSATAPFDCPKSALIRERALQFTLANIPDAAYGQMGTLELLACYDPSNPAHAGIPARAAAQALTIVPTPERMELMMNGYVEYLESSASWRYGHQLVVLSEYHLATGDAQVLPAIQAIANMVANGGSIYGTYGHGFARDPVPAMDNRLAVAPYGPVNNAGLTCHLGLVLAKKCGVATPAVEATIERCNSYYGSHVGYGGIPYGENMPWVQNTGMNGKSGMAALAFSLQTGHHDEVNYFTKMAAASAGERQGGHSSPLFGQLWTPLGAALGGEQAFAEHFARIRWLLTLNRRWDGAFVFNSVIQDGSGENNSLMGRAYYMNTVALLTYAVPLKKIAITGKYADPSDFLSASEVEEVAYADGYDATSRTISELLADCGSFSMAVTNKVAEEIGKRTGEHATALPVLSAMAADPSSPGRVGAMLALGRIANPSTLQVLVDALMDPDPVVRKNAARAMQYYKNQDKLTVVNQIMDAVVANEKPLNPPDPDDPLQFAQSELSSLLFYGGNADGPQGFLINSLAGVDRERLYEVIRVISALPLGKARSNLRYVFDDLTEEDLKRVSGPVLDMTLSRAPGDGMFGKAGEDAAVNLLSRYGKAETIPAAKRVADSYKVTKPNWIGPQLAVLEDKAGSCLLVNPDPRIVDFCNALQFLKIFPDSFPQGAQAVLDAIAADTSPEVLTPLKGIDSLTADSSVLTLPSDRTVLRADAFDYAGGSVFTWRKLHGAGEVIFAPNGTADAATTTVLFDGVPGEYLFEVTQSDWRNQTEVKQTVAVRLEMIGGGLPPNDPPAADPQTLPVSRGLATPVILTGTDPEGHGLNYSILSGPANGILSGTPPLLTYRSVPGYTGTDTFDFQVMDSEGQVASATITLNVSDATPVGLAIYEPFNYGVDIALNGKSGSGDVGFASPWVATGTTTPTVRAGSLGDGDIPTLGGHVAQSKNLRAERAISTTALAGRGLLDDGKTLWFSVYAGYEANSNLTNSQLCIALANHTFASGTFNKWIKDDGTQLGSGLGIFVGGGSSSNIRAAEFRDESFGIGTLGVLKGSWEAVSPSLALNEYAFIVGKITWGATPTDDDRIEVYHSITPYLLPEQPTSVLETQVDQGTFDMLTISAGDYGRFDEIRFGDSFQSVVAGTVEMSDDASAPTPDPPGFHQAPFVSAFDEISMSATPAFDPNNVEYYFTCTAGGGHDSGWQSSPHYTDAGLAPGVTYSYTVTARDLSLARNTSSPSAASSATTPADWVVRDMVGMNAAAAEYLIVDRGLSVGHITYAYHPTIPEGEIISQNLTAGSSALLGTAVDLVVSLGQTLVVVPNVGELAQSVAETAITNASLLVGTVTTQYSAQAAGEVISQNPAAGAMVLAGTPVDLVVSGGPASTNITIADQFTFTNDYAPADNTSNTIAAIDGSLSIDTGAFSAIGSKLVAVLSLHNSAAAVSIPSNATFGGVALTETLSHTGGNGQRQYIYYLDNVAVDGAFAFDFTATTGTDSNRAIDEVGLHLFALNGAEEGGAYASQNGSIASSAVNNPFSSPADAAGGDFVVGIATRNNNNNTLSSASPYTQTNITTGNMHAITGYHLVDLAGSTAPVFSKSAAGGSTTIQSFAAFAPLPVAQVQVPDVVGLAQAAAEAAITGATLSVGTVTNDYSPSVPAGDVISQNPAAGVTINIGSIVNLVVSLGPLPQVNVPNVVGLAQATAESDITGADLTVGTVTFQNDELVPAGDVISQNPAAGALVDTGSSVDLVVSYGPQPTVPDVVGLAQSAAQSAITGASLTLGVVTTTFSPTVPAGDVISQSPAAGLSVDTGLSVDLVVSHGANPAPGTIIDSFSYRFDFAPADVIFGTDGATPPITIDTTGFTAAGTDKLVIILSVHNSANDIAPITGLTYGGVDVYDNLVAGANLTTGSGTKNFIFHLDDPATDGDLVVGFDDTVATIQDIDEIGVVLFALDGLQPGTAYASESQTAGAFTPANANVGDFVVAVAQRNNQPGTITVTNNPPYSEIDITKGELTSRVGYQVASAAGPTAPSFSGFVQYQSFAAFAAAAPPSSAYDTWASTNAPTTGSDPTADEDGDGVSNGIEFVLGGTIATSDLGRLPVVSNDGTNLIFSFQRAQQSINPSVAVRIEVGTDLATWPEVYPVPDAATVGPPVTVEKDSSPGMDTVTLGLPMTPGTRKFARLKVAITP